MRVMLLTFLDFADKVTAGTHLEHFQPLIRQAAQIGEVSIQSPGALISPLLRSADVSCSLAFYPPNFEQAVHSHHEPSVSLILSGEVCETAGKEEVCVGPSYTVRKPAGLRHANRFGRSGAVVLSISVHNPQTWAAAAPDARWDWQPLAAGIFAEMVQLGSAAQKGDAAEIMHSLLAAAAPRVARTGTAPKWLLDVRQMISDDPSAAVADLAEGAGFHPVYLCRAFASWFGTTPVVYRRQQRTAVAIAALLEGRPASHVAHDCGFSDQSHMCRGIKRSTGHSISELISLWRAPYCRLLSPHPSPNG